MSLFDLPVVDAQFKNQHGDLFTVIGKGTRGIIIEYINGKVELISPKNWGTMSNSAILEPKH